MNERVVVVNAGKMNYDHLLGFFLFYQMMYRSMTIVLMQSLLNAFKGLVWW